MLRVIWIEASGYQFPAVQRPVVSVRAAFGTAEGAQGVSCQHDCPEGAPVPYPVPPLGGCAAALFCLALTLVASSPASSSGDDSGASIP